MSFILVYNITITISPTPACVVSVLQITFNKAKTVFRGVEPALRL